MPSSSRRDRFSYYVTASAKNLYDSQKWKDSNFNWSPPMLFTKTTSPEYIPGWSYKIVIGQSATTVLIGTAYKWKLGVFTSRLFPDSTVFPRYADAVGRSVAPTIPTSYSTLSNSQATAEAQIAFAKNYRKKINALQSGVVLAEARQALQLIVRPGRAISALALKYSNTNLRLLGRALLSKGNRKGILRDVSSAHLQYQFGVKPLVSDLLTGVENIQRLNGGRLKSKAVKITGKSTIEILKTPPLTTFWNMAVAGVPTTGIFSCINDVIDRTDCEIVGYLRRGEFTDFTALELLGLDPSQALPSIYEVIPYSFLVDYFTTLGDCINAFSIRFSAITWFNRRIRNSRISRQYGYQTTSKFQQLTGPEKQSVVLTHVEREPFNFSSTTPLPTYRWTTSGHQWLNVAALAGQSVKAKSLIAQLLR